MLPVADIAQNDAAPACEAYVLALFCVSSTTQREKQTLAGIAKEREKKLLISFLWHMLRAFVPLATSERTYGAQAVNLQNSRDPGPKAIGNAVFSLHVLSYLILLCYRK